MATLTHRRYTSNRALRTDPTRTTGIRLRFMRDVNRRWQAIQRDIIVSIVDNDCFGIQPRTLAMFRSGLVQNTPIRPKAFAFERTPQKIELFMQWLRDQEAQGVLEIIRRPGVRLGGEGAWSDLYIQTSYQQGIRRGRAELRRAGYKVPSLDAAFGGAGAVMNLPIHADTVGLLYTRTFEELKSVTGIVNAQTRRLVSEGLTSGLARGIAEGKNPRLIARELARDVNHRINVIGKTRMRMIARTEVIRAHHLANMNEYEQAQVEGVALVAEWLTAGDPCVICIEISEGGPYKIEEARGMLPAHPNCRCVVVPVPKKQTAQPPPPRPPLTPPAPRPSSYTQQTTLAGAESWFHSLRKGTITYEGKRGFGSRLPESKRLPFMNELNTEIARLQDTYGIKIPPTHDWHITRANKGKATLGSIRETNTRIAFPKAWTPQEIAYAQEWERANGRPWSVGAKAAALGEDAGGLLSKSGIRHELAHRVDGQLRLTKRMDFYHMQKVLRDDHGFRAANISNYARKEPEEWFAEAFARYTSPNYLREGKFPKPLEDYMEMVLEAMRPAGN